MVTQANHCIVLYAQMPNFQKKKQPLLNQLDIYIYILANTQWQRHDSLKLFWQESKTQENGDRVREIAEENANKYCSLDIICVFRSIFK